MNNCGAINSSTGQVCITEEHPKDTQHVSVTEGVDFFWHDQTDPTKGSES